jgi:hypothetical protein
MANLTCVDVDKNEITIKFYQDMLERENKQLTNKHVTSSCIMKYNLANNKIRLLFIIYSQKFIKMWWIGLPMLVIFYLLNLNLMWSIIPVFMISFDYLQSDLFIFHVMKFGLRKAKYKGEIRRLSNKELIAEFVNGTI